MSRKKIEAYRKYYLLLSDGQEVIDYKIPYNNRGCLTWKNVYDGDVVKVLGPVPTSDQLKELIRLAKIGEKYDRTRSNEDVQRLRGIQGKTL